MYSQGKIQSRGTAGHGVIHLSIVFLKSYVCIHSYEERRAKMSEDRKVNVETFGVAGTFRRGRGGRGGRRGGRGGRGGRGRGGYRGSSQQQVEQ